MVKIKIMRISDLIAPSNQSVWAVVIVANEIRVLKKIQRCYTTGGAAVRTSTLEPNSQTVLFHAVTSFTAIDLERDTHVLAAEMFRFKSLLLFLLFAAGAFANVSRNFYGNHIYLPRCRFNDQILENTDKFEKEVSRSDFVFTGKVTNGDIYYKDNLIIFSVAVRRYFKNALRYPKTKEVRIIKTLNEGEGVKCRQPIRPKFTAIFIGRRLKHSKDADIFLEIEPVPVTLYNLDRVTAAVKGTPEKKSILSIYTITPWHGQKSRIFYKMY